MDFTDDDILLSELSSIYKLYYKEKKNFSEGTIMIHNDYMPLSSHTSETNELQIEIQRPDAKNKNESNVKGLFRRIALITHPDKQIGKHKYSESLFNEAKKAEEKGKFVKLCFLTTLLHMPIPSFTEDERKQIRDTIQKKQTKINHYRKTYAYQYKFADEITKEKLLNSLKHLDKELHKSID